MSRDIVIHSDPEMLSTNLDDGVADTYKQLLKVYAMDKNNELAMQKAGLISDGASTGLLSQAFELLHNSEDVRETAAELKIDSLGPALGEKIHADRRKIQMQAFDEHVDEAVKYALSLGTKSNNNAEKWRRYEDPLELTQAEQITQAGEVKAMLKELYRGTKLGA